MEPLNDNGQRPEEKPNSYFGARRRNTIPLVIAIVLGVCFIAVPMLLFVSLIALRGYSHVQHTVSYNAVELELISEREELIQERVHQDQLGRLSLLGPSDNPQHADAYGNFHFEVGELNRLNLTMQSGSLYLNTHNEPHIHIYNSNSSNFSYQFNPNRGTLDLTKHRDTSIRILVPHSHEEAIFQAINITNQNGGILIHGKQHDNSYITQNLAIATQNGNISLNNLTISNNLSLSSQAGNMHLTNIIADPNRFHTATNNGNIVINH